MAPNPTSLRFGSSTRITGSTPASYTESWRIDIGPIATGAPVRPVAFPVPGAGNSGPFAFGRLPARVAIRAERGVGGSMSKTATAGKVESRTNGTTARSGDEDEVLRRLEAAMRAAAAGDFSASPPGATQGRASASSRPPTTSSSSATRSCTAELVRIGRVIGREGRMTERASLAGRARRLGRQPRLGQRAVDDLVRPTTEVARVLDAVAEGDLTQKMALTIEGQPVKGEFLRIGTTVNTMVDQLVVLRRRGHARGARGRHRGQARRPGRGAGRLRHVARPHRQRELHGLEPDRARCATSPRSRPRSPTATSPQKITVDAKGEVARAQATRSTRWSTSCRSFADEVTRVAREVGTEGKLGGQAEVRGRLRHVARPDRERELHGVEPDRPGAQHRRRSTTAVANGDLSQKITVEAKGEVAALADTINAMADTLGVVRRAGDRRGARGRHRGQARRPGRGAGRGRHVEGPHRLGNPMAGNLTDQVRNIAAGHHRGRQRRPVAEDHGRGARARSPSSPTRSTRWSTTLRVVRRPGHPRRARGRHEGMLGGQAEVPGVAGTWKDLTDNVNFMAGNLTDQVRNIAQVTTAVAKGDLTQKITVDVKGEVLELKNTINTMVDQLSLVRRRGHARRARGRHRGQARRPGRGQGRLGHLARPDRERQLHGAQPDRPGAQHRRGDHRRRQRRPLAEDHRRRQGRDPRAQGHHQHDGRPARRRSPTRSRAWRARSAPRASSAARPRSRASSGTWRGLTENVNCMARNLTDQVRNIAAGHDRGRQRRPVQEDHRRGQGRGRSSWPTRSTRWSTSCRRSPTRSRASRARSAPRASSAARPRCEGVSGTWRDLTDNVNLMAAQPDRPGAQHRPGRRPRSPTATCQKITVDAQGEILELKQTINTMVDQLSSFADEVTRVAREVGTEGKLGGQAEVEGVSGTWRDLTENVNQLAGNLTTQVRAIAEVSTAVTQGDLTRSITVEAAGRGRRAQGQHQPDDRATCARPRRPTRSRTG